MKLKNVRISVSEGNEIVPTDISMFKNATGGKNAGDIVITGAVYGLDMTALLQSTD